VKLKIAIVALAALAVSSCAVEGGKGIGGSVFVPTSSAVVVISPQFLPIVPITTFGCPFASPFGTDFSLFVSAGGTSTSLNHVTLRLNDGSSVGGPTVTFPQADLTRMFGSTIIVDTRTFTFQPQFGCFVGQPRSLIAELTLVDTTGRTRTLTTSASFR
jgi:hypothetical protein